MLASYVKTNISRTFVKFNPIDRKLNTLRRPSRYVKVTKFYLSENLLPDALTTNKVGDEKCIIGLKRHSSDIRAKPLLCHAASLVAQTIGLHQNRTSLSISFIYVGGLKYVTFHVHGTLGENENFCSHFQRNCRFKRIFHHSKRETISFNRLTSSIKSSILCASIINGPFHPISFKTLKIFSNFIFPFPTARCWSFFPLLSCT